MPLLRRIRQSKASRNAATSYLAFFSTALWGLVSIPVAVAFLPPAELGLWTVINAFLGYLTWMDLGVGSATGRMMAEAVARRDQKEINCWWTTTRFVLFCQAILLIFVGLVLTPLVLGYLALPSHLVSEAKFVLIGGVFIAAFGLPMRGTPGLLTAQERFYWIPLVQAVTPWINLLAFFLLLKGGHGLRSYVWAMAASQLATWLAFNLLIHTGPDRPRFDRGGINRDRFRSLFIFSGNMSVSGISDALFNSLPAILIARLGGLATVPIYNFSWKGPMLGSGIVQRTYQSFYPGLQRLHVSGKPAQFKAKYRLTGFLTLGIALCAAGMVLACNTLIVQVLAGGRFYAGPAANTGFALAMITIPMCGFFRILLPISGNLGKIPWISLLQIAFFATAALILWKPFGLAGIAFAFALTPLCKGIYGYLRGSRNCGYRPFEMSGTVALSSIAAMILVSLCGIATSFMDWQGGMTCAIGNRNIAFPPFPTLAASLIPTATGLALLFKAARDMLRHRAP
jgi:O-antigen/teichoic acid export membrane protein